MSKTSIELGPLFDSLAKIVNKDKRSGRLVAGKSKRFTTWRFNGESVFKTGIKIIENPDPKYRLVPDWTMTYVDNRQLLIALNPLLKEEKPSFAVFTPNTMSENSLNVSSENFTNRGKPYILPELTVIEVDQDQVRYLEMTMTDAFLAQVLRALAGLGIEIKSSHD